MVRLLVEQHAGRVFWQSPLRVVDFAVEAIGRQSVVRHLMFACLLQLCERLGLRKVAHNLRAALNGSAARLHPRPQVSQSTEVLFCRQRVAEVHDLYPVVGLSIAHTVDLGQREWQGATWECKHRFQLC